MPFGKYKDFAECVADNQDKANPEAYCALLHYKITGRWPGEKEGVLFDSLVKCAFRTALGDSAESGRAEPAPSSPDSERSGQ